MTDSFRRWMEFAGTRAVRVLASVFIAFLIARALKAVTARLIQLAKSQSRVAQMREQQTRTMAALLYSVGIGIIVAVAFLTALPEFGFNVSPIEAAAAVASLAFGFGAQHLVKDLINGFFIVFEDQFVIGDLIQTNGETGRVEHLTLRRAVLRNAACAMGTVPYAIVGQGANLSRDLSQVFLDISVPSEEMVGHALTALEKIAADFRNDAD